MKRNAGEVLNHPKALDKTPIFTDHSLLHHLNQQSQSLNLGTVFDECLVPQSFNNGEKFLKPYHLKQVDRNDNFQFDIATKRCTCELCTAPAVAEVAIEEASVAEVPDAVIPPVLEEQVEVDVASVDSGPRPPPYASHEKFKPCICLDDDPWWLCDDMKDYWKKRWKIDLENRKYKNSTRPKLSIRGRPPHSYNCPKHSMFNGVAAER